MANTTPAEQTEWWNVWGQIKAASAQLDGAVAKLQSQAAYVKSRPNLRADFNAITSSIESARAKLMWLRDAVKGTLNYFGAGLSGLGFLPLIPIAIVTAGVAYVAKLAANAWALSARIDEQRRLESTGMSPAQAAQLANQTNPTGGSLFSFDLGTGGTVVLVGAGALALWWFFGRGKRG